MLCRAFVCIMVALVASVSAHMTMTDPCPRASPYCVKPAGSPPPSSDWDASIIKSPIDYNTPKFCKSQMKWSQPAAIWTAGQSITVKFYYDGAAHSGGHAQFSISYDGGKNFVVVYQVLKYFFFSGPAKLNNTAQFLSYTFTLPKDLPSSDSAVFSWSWVGASGNAEFYQNCADVVIKGNGSKSYTGKKMVIANINGYPTIYSMYEHNYLTGLELYNNAPSITVTGSGTTSGGTASKTGAATKADSDTISAVKTTTASKATSAAPVVSVGSGASPVTTTLFSTGGTSSGGISSGGSGCTHGAMNCASGSTGYEVCVLGTITPMPCAPGTKCKANGAGSIICDYA